MDGTLTVPVIDFAAMYMAVLGEDEYKRIKAENPSGIDILHQIEKWSPDKQRKAYEIIADHKRQGLDRLQIMPGAAELCGFLDSKKIRRGLITHNVKDAVDLFHKRFGVGDGHTKKGFCTPNIILSGQPLLPLRQIKLHQKKYYFSPNKSPLQCHTPRNWGIRSKFCSLFTQISLPLNTFFLPFFPKLKDEKVVNFLYNLYLSLGLP